jgi:IMP dehydrogenase/GMP reductase
MFDYKDINLISRHISTIKSRDEVDISSKIFGIKRNPIIASPMKDVCNSAVANIMENNGSLGIIHRFMSIDKQVAETNELMYPICAIGINGDYLDRYKELVKHGVKTFCIDVANSSSIFVKNTVKDLLNIFPAKFIVGNAISVEGVDFYNDLPEVEAVRCGVAGGNACTTQSTTGMYYPMATLISECSRNTDKKIIADGGIRTASDYCKALALGADFVMIGGLISKTKESPAELISVGEKQFKLLHGSASYENQKIYKEVPRYIEGKTVFLEYENESLEDFLERFNQGLRSSMSYANAFDLNQYRDNVSILTNRGYL